jgi:hypothetical protein
MFIASRSEIARIHTGLILVHQRLLLQNRIALNDQQSKREVA